MIEGKEKQTGRHWLKSIEDLARERKFEVTQWGGTDDDLPLLGFTRAASKGGASPLVYLSAGIHGDEPAGPLAVENLLRNNLLHHDVSWTICPLLNPSGWLQGIRENAGGIDLNRDYLARRSQEAAAHCAWIDALPCHHLYLSLHEDWEATGFYLYEINSSEKPPFADKILREVASIIPIEPLACIDQHTVCAPGYISHPPEPDEPLNWPEAIYHCKRYPHLSYTFETPSSRPMAQRIRAHVTATRTATDAFIELKQHERP